MPKKNALQALRKQFGQPEESDFDPELFLLRFAETVAKGNAELAEKLLAKEKSGEVDLEVLSTKIVSIIDRNFKDIGKQLAERKIEKVEVEHIREVPPSKIKLEYPVQKNQHLPEKQQRWWISALNKVVKSPIDDIRIWLGEALQALQKPENAIAVRLTRKDADDFYNAIITAIGGGGGTTPGTLVTTSSGKTLKSVPFSLSSTNHVVSAVGGKKIAVYAIKLIVSANLTVNFRDGGSTDLEGPQPYVANGGATEAVSPPEYLFATSTGNDLDLVITAGSGTASGRISYFEND